MKNLRKETATLVQNSNSNKMTRRDLILTIINLYPDTFRSDRPEHVQAWVEIYEKAIPSNWDMDKLLYHFATCYKSTVVPPHPSFFYDFRNDVRPQAKSQSLEPFVQTPEEEEACRKKVEEYGRRLRELNKKMDINNILK